MADDGKITLEIDAETGSITTKVAGVITSIGSLGEKAEASTGQMAAGFAIAEIAVQALEKAFEILVDIVKESIAASERHEQSLLQMNLALANAGIYSDQASQSMIEFADALSKTSLYSKDVILDVEKMAINFGKTEDMAKKLTTAALSLSAATGKDVGTAMQVLGRSLTGATTGLERLIPGMKNLTETELQNGGAADMIIERYGRTLPVQLETFHGHTVELKKAWDELLISFGDSITKSPLLIKAIDFITSSIQKLTAVLQKNKAFFDAFLAVFMAGGMAIGKLPEKVDPAKKALEDLNNTAQKTHKTFLTVGKGFSLITDGMTAQAKDMQKNAGKSFETLGKQMFTAVGQGAGQAFAAFGNALATGGNALAEFGKSLLKSLGQAAVQMGTEFILMGTAAMYAPVAGLAMGVKNPGALIASGAALAAFGGLLSGLGGGGSPSGSAIGAGAGATSIGGDQASVINQASGQDLQNKQAQIIVNGDFLNSRETANHLADIIRQNSDITDYTITAQGRSYA